MVFQLFACEDESLFFNGHLGLLLDLFFEFRNDDLDMEGQTSGVVSMSCVSLLNNLTLTINGPCLTSFSTIIG